MTGYGRAAAVDGSLTAAAEIRTVNHRYFDARIRLPRELLGLEDTVRQMVQRRLQRGRVEITITVEDSGEQSRTVKVDRGLLKQAREALGEARLVLGVTEEPSLSHLALIPDLFRMEEPSADLDRCRAVVQTALTAALTDVIDMRRVEGQALADDIAARIDVVEEWVATVKERVPDVVGDTRARLRRRIAELIDDAVVDEGRLELEVAMLAERGDVSEETARIASHIAQLRSLLQGGGPVGRKLDFLLQELNREWSTIGAKANDAVIAQAVVEARAELEKIREQVQNIE